MARTKLAASAVLPLWHRALDLEFGLAIRTDDKRWLTNLLYEARQEAKDLRLQDLMVFQPNGDEVWIVKQDVELG